MGSTTTKWGIDYPVSTDPTNVPGDIESPMDQIDLLLAPVKTGPLAGRPAYGKQGQAYQVSSGDASNYGQCFLDTGSGWISVGAINSSINPGVGAGSLVSNSAPGNSTAQGGSALAAAADHVHAREAFGSGSDIQGLGASASAGSSGRVADAQHTHPGGQIGDVLYTFAASPPSNFIVAHGQAVSQTTYASLYALALAQSWPQNSPGSGNFNVLDLRDVLPVGGGLSYAVGSAYGSSTVTLTVGQLPSHVHLVPAIETGTETASHNHPISGWSFVIGIKGNQNNSLGGPVGAGGAGVTFTAQTDNEGAAHAHVVPQQNTNSTGNGSPVPNLPPVVAMNVFVRAL